LTVSRRSQAFHGGRGVRGGAEHPGDLLRKPRLAGAGDAAQQHEPLGLQREQVARDQLGRKRELLAGELRENSIEVESAFGADLRRRAALAGRARGRAGRGGVDDRRRLDLLERVLVQADQGRPPAFHLDLALASVVPAHWQLVGIALAMDEPICAGHRADPEHAEEAVVRDDASPTSMLRNFQTCGDASVSCARCLNSSWVRFVRSPTLGQPIAMNPPVRHVSQSFASSPAAIFQ
jgi:hypothetical protein